MVKHSAAKAAMVNMTIGLAQHMTGPGITTNRVSPGVTLADGMRRMSEDGAAPRTRHIAYRGQSALSAGERGEDRAVEGPAVHCGVGDGLVDGVESEGADPVEIKIERT